MILLNILPDSIKKEIKINSTYKLVKKILALLVLLITLYACAFLFFKFSLTEKLSALEIEALNYKKNDNYFSQINNINEKLDLIESIQNNEIKWSYLLEFFSSNISPQIKLSSIYINKPENKIIFKGQAATRENLVDFKNMLLASGFFDQVNLPYYTQKENIDFTIDAQIIKYSYE